MVTVHAFSMRSVHLGGLAEERNIHPMYDMEQYSFWKILDKMTDPVQREKKYTGEDPESQLRQLFFCMFVCFCVPPQVQHLSGGKFHRLWDDNILFVIFFFCMFCSFKSIKNRNGKPSASVPTKGGLDRRFRRSGCCCWLCTVGSLSLLEMV